MEAPAKLTQHIPYGFAVMNLTPGWHSCALALSKMKLVGLGVHGRSKVLTWDKLYDWLPHVFSELDMGLFAAVVLLSVASRNIDHAPVLLCTRGR